VNKLRQLTMIVIIGNWVVGVWHLFLVAKILVPPNNKVSRTAIILITLGHLSVLGALWKLAEKWAAVVSLVLFLVALGVGIYEHFLGPGPNNVFRVALGGTGTLFAVSVYILVGLELLGCWLAARLLTGRGIHGPHGSLPAHAA